MSRRANYINLPDPSNYSGLISVSATNFYSYPFQEELHQHKQDRIIFPSDCLYRRVVMSSLVYTCVLVFRTVSRCRKHSATDAGVSHLTSYSKHMPGGLLLSHPLGDGSAAFILASEDENYYHICLKHISSRAAMSVLCLQSSRVLAGEDRHIKVSA